MTQLIGCDLAQRSDYTAIVTLDQYWRREQEEPDYNVNRINRVRGRSYTDIASMMRAYVEQLDDPHLILDATGVGVAVADIFRKEGLEFTEVTFTSGREWHSTDEGFSVPKTDLVSVVQALLAADRLHVSPRVKNAELLQGELRNLGYKITQAGRTSHAAKGQGHDDLFFALAIALWVGEYGRDTQTYIPTTIVRGAKPWGHGTSQSGPSPEAVVRAALGAGFEPRRL